MKKPILYFLLLCFLLACKNKKKLDSTQAYFSVVNFIGSQVKQADSAKNSFTKIVSVDSTSDTSKITKQQFDTYAKEFLNIPDIASTDKMDDYKETNSYDETLGSVLLIYTPKKDDAEVRNETIMMQPDDQGNTHVKTILVNTIKAGKDSTIEKEMTWHVDQRFQIVTKVTKPNQPEKINTVIVQWE